MGNTGALNGCGVINRAFFDEYVRSRGSAVHKACHFIDEDDFRWDLVDRRIHPYLRAYLKFKRESRIRYVSIEIPIWNKVYWYATTPDRDGYLNGRRVVVQIKTTRPGRWVGLQLALEDLALGGGRDRFVLELRKDGTPKLWPFTDPTDYPVALCAVTIANWKNKK